MKTILIIEDDQTMQKAYQAMLTKAGYAILPASSYNEAVSQLESTAVPDCIILDIMLPGGKDGLEILQEVRTVDAWKGIPVVVLTNLDSERNRARELGVSAYLVKSNTSIDVIVSTIKQLIGE